MAFTLLALVAAPQQAPDLTTVVRTTLERGVSEREAVIGRGLDLADADRAVWAGDPVSERP